MSVPEKTSPNISKIFRNDLQERYGCGPDFIIKLVMIISRSRTDDQTPFSSRMLPVFLVRPLHGKTHDRSHAWIFGSSLPARKIPLHPGRNLRGNGFSISGPAPFFRLDDHTLPGVRAFSRALIAECRVLRVKRFPVLSPGNRPAFPGPEGNVRTGKLGLSGRTPIHRATGSTVSPNVQTKVRQEIPRRRWGVFFVVSMERGVWHSPTALGPR